MPCCKGPSGSGKTTLLDLLGGRKTGSVGRQEGEIVVDGVLGREGGVGTRGAGGSAYVMQVRREVQSKCTAGVRVQIGASWSRLLWAQFFVRDKSVVVWARRWPVRVV